MATLPVSALEVSDSEPTLELPLFPDELRTALLLQIIRSIRDKVITVTNPTWGFDDFREYQITDLVNALTWRIANRDLEPTTINFLVVDNAFESWIETFYDGFEFMDGDMESAMPETLSADEVQTFNYNRDVRVALRLLAEAVRQHQESLQAYEA